MPFRPTVKLRNGVRNSKYSDIYEYYKASDSDKAVRAFYIAIRDTDDKVRKVKTDAKNKDEALKLLNEERARVRTEKKILETTENHTHQRIRHNNLCFDDMALFIMLIVPLKIITKTSNATTITFLPSLVPLRCQDSLQKMS